MPFAHNTEIKNSLKLQLDPDTKVLRWRLKTNMEQHKENVQAREKEWKEYERKKTVYHEQFNNIRRRLETLLRAEKESRFPESCDAAIKVLRRIKDFGTDFHEAERITPDVLKARIATRENMAEKEEALERKLKKGKYHATLDNYKWWERKNLETKFDEQEVSRYTRVPTTYAVKGILWRMKDFMIELHKFESRILDICRKLIAHEHQLFQLEMNITYMDQRNPERIKYFFESMDIDLTIGMSKWERNKTILESCIVKWENMVERDRENLFGQYQRFIEQMRLKPDLEEKIQVHEQNVEDSHRKWEKYESKNRVYHKKLYKYKSARRNLETKLKPPVLLTIDFSFDRITKTCDAVSKVQQRMKDFTTKVEEAECGILDRHKEMRDRDVELYILTNEMTLTDESHPHIVSHLSKNMEKYVTRTLEIWNREKDCLEEQIELWEEMVGTERENVAAGLQEYIDIEKQLVNESMASRQGVNAAVGGVTVGVATILSGGLLLPALVGAGIGMGAIAVKDTVFFAKARIILTAAEDMVKAMRE